MKWLALAVLVVVAPRPSHACTLFGMSKEDDEGTGEKIEVNDHAILPLVVAGGGFTSDGLGWSANAGVGWGRRQLGGCGEGYVITRVLAGVRRAVHADASLTYGWYATGPVSLGLDVGLEADHTGAGPTARLSLGSQGIMLRFTGGAMIGTDTRFVGAAELVLEITDLVTHSGGG